MVGFGDVRFWSVTTAGHASTGVRIYESNLNPLNVRTLLANIEEGAAVMAALLRVVGIVMQYMSLNGRHCGAKFGVFAPKAFRGETDRPSGLIYLPNLSRKIGGQEKNTG